MMPYTQNGIAIGIVVAVYPEGQSVDILLSDDGTRLSNVQVMVPTGSSNTGQVDLPDPGLPVDDSRWNFNTNPERIIRGVVAFYRGQPVCIGFILPQVTQVTFKEKNRRIVRHASDVYTSVDQFGNTELYHPSGVYLRIGTSPAHEDLTGQDFDKKWAITKNTAAAVHVHVKALGGTSLDIDPAGNITLIGGGTLSISAVTSIALSAPDISLTGTASIGLTAPTVTVNGLAVTTGGNVSGTGNIHTTGTITGDTDVIAAGKSGGTHFHHETGTNTGPPLP